MSRRKRARAVTGFMQFFKRRSLSNFTSGWRARSSTYATSIFSVKIPIRASATYLKTPTCNCKTLAKWWRGSASSVSRAQHRPLGQRDRLVTLVFVIGGCVCMSQHPGAAATGPNPSRSAFFAHARHSSENEHSTITNAKKQMKSNRKQLPLDI